MQGVNVVTNNTRDSQANDLDYTALDPGIVLAVRLLRDEGVATLCSCEGGECHTYLSPTVVFLGDAGEALRVIHIAHEARLGPCSITKVWRLADGIPDFLGPKDLLEMRSPWEITFACKFPSDPPVTAAHATRLTARDDAAKQWTEESTWRHQLLKQMCGLEPKLEQLFNRVRAGEVDLNDLWLTYLFRQLTPILGPTRDIEREGPPLLTTTKAFDAVLISLYEVIPITPNDPYRPDGVDTTAPSFKEDSTPSDAQGCNTLSMTTDIRERQPRSQ
jgi:hypothetical protein